MSTNSMARSLLVRGMLTGIAAGIVAFLVARLFGESSVNAAIAVEAAHTAAHAAANAAEPVAEHSHEAGGFGRGVQSGLGLLTATVLYGIGLGGIFSLVFASTLGRLGRFGPRSLAALLAGAAFVTLSLVPFLKYPPNPPATGDPETIGWRTALYFTMIVISLALAGLAVWSGRRLAPALGGWNATIAAAGGYVLLIGLCQWALPVVQEVGADFPAVTLYQFRLASLGIQLAVWATIGLVFGALADRVLAPGPAAVPTAAPVHA